MIEIKAKEPSRTSLEQFLAPSMMAAKGYHIDAPAVGIKLDQNESPWDWPADVKDAILAKLKERPWNRYPSPFGDELVDKIAVRVGVNRDCILLGPGSNYLIGLVLQTFSKGISGKVVLARPSFALYENHCQYESIPYEVWPLNDDLEYDVSLLPELPKGSMVMFASPNNPVGNVLSRARLEELLLKYPDVLWIGDEAYCEFADESYTELLAKFSNLILLRTFSKTLGAAGLRLGYVLAAANVITEIKKPRVPFLINSFSLVAASEVLSNPAMTAIFDGIVQNAMTERDRVAQSLVSCGLRLGFKIKISQANFVLARWPSTEQSTSVYKRLLHKGILVRNVANAPGLAGCLRISVGTTIENNQLLAAFLSM
ncbi:MAG: histidinol-phosphate transaminase [Proteobacteria bacterium]|nr:histidinol-phosphate transaminase [Pseudomonadota bacterium]